MRQPKLGRALRLVLRKLAEKTVNGAAIKTRPESRFAHCLAAGHGHGLIIIRHPADHVGMWFDVAHFGDGGLNYACSRIKSVAQRFAAFRSASLSRSRSRMN